MQKHNPPPSAPDPADGFGPPSHPPAQSPAPAAAPGAPPPHAQAPGQSQAPGHTPAPSQGVEQPPAPAPWDYPPTQSQEPQVISTGGETGLVKCPRCGATEIVPVAGTGQLQCTFCRFQWNPAAISESLNLVEIGQLQGLVMGSGASDIIPSTEDILTFKCGACAAEVVVDTAHSTQARCHWCRNKLSVNEQIPNGAVPDMILPFKLTQAEAVEKISAFVAKRKFYANRKFKAEFNPGNVMGVYMPYVVVDINAHGTLHGEGEHTTRSYTVRRGNNDTERRYDADLYQVARDFDIHIEGLTVESSAERRDQDFSRNTNNIINTILPFDIENSVGYDSNYLAGFTSERRDTNIEALQGLVTNQSGDIARYRANESLQFYDRGVRWTSEQVDVVGQRWMTAYLPVWLYSYHETKSNGQSMVHYVAVNARTGETMGSIPLSQRRLVAASLVVQAVSMVALFFYLILS